eukprot:1147723-Pelagomonas_calceolata.AAC.5
MRQLSYDFTSHAYNAHSYFLCHERFHVSLNCALAVTSVAADSMCHSMLWLKTTLCVTTDSMYQHCVPWLLPCVLTDSMCHSYLPWLSCVTTDSMRHSMAWLTTTPRVTTVSMYQHCVPWLLPCVLTDSMCHGTFHALALNRLHVSCDCQGLQQVLRLHARHKDHGQAEPGVCDLQLAGPESSSAAAGGHLETAA